MKSKIIRKTAGFILMVLLVPGVALLSSTTAQAQRHGRVVIVRPFPRFHGGFGVLLKPNEPTVADWFVLADSTPSGEADVWYDTLPVGKYELTIQRRLACCDGPMVESNTINFAVVP